MGTNIGTPGDVYKYSIEAKILLNGGKDIQTIKENCIQYMYVDRDFFKYNMPMIFLSLVLDKNVIDKMIQYASNSVINLTVYKFISSNTGSASIKTLYFQEQFAYFMGKDYNTNKSMDYSYINSNRTDVQANLTIGLLKVDHINKNKKKFGGVLKGSSLTDAVYYCCDGLPLLLEPFNYDKTITQLIMPPISSVSKAITYLNDNFCTFYDSPFRFFMDFDTSYLISSSGKPIPRKGDKINSIVVNIRKINQESSYIQGMVTDNKKKIYEIDVGQNDAYVVENTSTEKAVNKITGVGAGGLLTAETIDTNRSTFTSTKEEMIRLSNNNTNLLKTKKYDLEMSNVVLEITKNDIDSSVFTINKEYSIRATDAYSNRDGKYILVKKREVFVRDNESMILSTLLTFNKVP